jgi:hypothetical protein
MGQQDAILNHMACGIEVITNEKDEVVAMTGANVS